MSLSTQSRSITHFVHAFVAGNCIRDSGYSSPGRPPIRSRDSGSGYVLPKGQRARVGRIARWVAALTRLRFSYWGSASAVLGVVGCLHGGGAVNEARENPFYLKNKLADQELAQCARPRHRRSLRLEGVVTLKCTGSRDSAGATPSVWMACLVDLPDGA
jgi:hypothetical protein